MLFWTIFAVLVVVAAGFKVFESKWLARPSMSQPNDDFKALKRSYLIVYLLAFAGDWLQGPYVYRLYQEYNFTQAEIGQLFICGFGASCIFGTFAGSLADKFGRKSACLAYGALYIGSCITKHFANYSILMFGRVLGGIATSLLFSSFESWVVAEHFKRSFPAEWLETIFATAQFGNGIVAISSGQVANLAADTFGIVAPFDVAIGFLIAMSASILVMWPENKGVSDEVARDRSLSAQMQSAIGALKGDPKLIILGLVQSLFEGSMYVFVFMWTPVLEKSFEYLPHGRVFACFMLCTMIGNCVFTISTSFVPSERSLQGVFAISALLFFIIGMNINAALTLIALLMFEVCVGFFWPSISTVKSGCIPEDVRATIYNLYRVPLNLIVVTILLNLDNISTDSCMLICGCLLTISTFLQILFLRLESPQGAHNLLGQEEEDDKEMKTRTVHDRNAEPVIEKQNDIDKETAGIV